MALNEGTTVIVYPLPHKHALHPELGDIPFTGSLKISAGSGFTRYYTWDGETRSVELWPRRERWNGSFGAYYPGPGSHWNANHGITRGVLEEGQKHLESINEAESWLASRRYAVYNHDGFVVDFYKNRGGGGTLEVAVWQILVRKQRPTALKGSHDELISVSK